MKNENKYESIVVGGGCFWCLEAVFRRVKGVEAVLSGYAGGFIEKPSYEQVSSGKTGHAEVVRLEFDENIILLEDILHIFFSLHDPTTPNRQGSDVGTQYRSIILYNDDQQKNIAEKIILEIGSEGIYEDPIVTELKKLKMFYVAEDYHQQYFEKNHKAAYCQIIIAPKVAKLRQKYGGFYK